MVDVRRVGALPWVLALVCALLLSLPAQAQTDNPAPGTFSVADLSEQLLPAVVNISTRQRIAGRRPLPVPDLPDDSPFRDFFDDFFDDEGGGDGPSRENSLGSGFIIDADGLIVTNNHVIEGADDIDVVLTDGRTYPATIIGRDEPTDLAVLRIEPDAPLPFVPFGNSDGLRIGDWVVAIGNPFGLGGSVSLGIVSAMNRSIGAGPYDAFIQTDAAINRGNSGGPLFNLAGEVIGVNTAILSPNGRSVGVGFAIPSSTVDAIVTQLVRFGATRRGMLGVHIQEVTPDLVEGLQLDRPRGALVSSVTEGGPADDAGIEHGDVIVRFAGRRIETSSDLPARVAQTPPGTEVDLAVIRRGERVDLTVTLALRDGEDADGLMLDEGPAPVSILGMELATVEEAVEQGFDVPEDAVGAVVAVVFSDGPAAAKEIEPGMLIVEVGQQLVQTPQD
ncbi:MAG: Do family serine endopeptidase, partial [Devosiaceae bacterium]|nr:Do family serine endopeptidase [Devosiaceae bacterium MH13]